MRLAAMAAGMLTVLAAGGAGARALIGYDADSKSVIAHWMDSFGAKYSSLTA